MPSTQAIQSPADAVNQALRRLGYKLRIGSLFDGSQAASVALDLYVQTRDALLRETDWDFAERNITLTLLKQSPVNGYVPPRVWNGVTDPPLGWLCEYAFPADCLKIRTVKAVPIFQPNFDPQPTLWDLANDNYFFPPQRVIVANIAFAIAVYTAQVTDPTTWNVDFCEAFVASLARRFAPSLGNLDVEKMEMADEAEAKHESAMEMGR